MTPYYMSVLYKFKDKTSGFTPKHSINHQLYRLTAIIRVGFENKQFVTAVFLILSQIFNKMYIFAIKINN